jgi:hypothetical protein
MAFVQRALGFTIQLGLGDFGNGGFKTVQVPNGLWATAIINKVGSPARNTANIEIAGLTGSLINQLSRVGLQPAAVRNNTISVLAGEAGGSMPVAFAGTIMEAWPDYREEANPTFRILADSAALPAVKPAAATSFSGSVSVTAVMGQLASAMGYTLEPNGVSAQLNKVYYSGTLRDQVLAAADEAGIYAYFEDDTKTLVLCPLGGSRNTAVPTISPQTGMVGYPSFIGPGKIALSTEYNQGLRFLGNIKVEKSIIAGANGKWTVIDLKHDLSTHPGGPWFSDIRANNAGAGS